MRQFYISFAFLIFVAPLLGAAQPVESVVNRATTSTLDIDVIGKGTVSVGGEWQFHTGDDLHWGSSSYDDSQWEKISVNKPLGVQNHSSYSGYAWYRRHLNVEPSRDSLRNLAILMPKIETVRALLGRRKDW
jgi:hypothetical protein